MGVTLAVDETAAMEEPQPYSIFLSSLGNSYRCQHGVLLWVPKDDESKVQGKMFNSAAAWKPPGQRCSL